MTSSPATLGRGSRRKRQRGTFGVSPTLVALLLVVAQSLLRWPGTRDSWFFADDLLFLSDIASGTDDTAWFFRTHQGHRMPLSFLLTEQVAQTGTYNWQAAAIQIAVMQALAALAVWIMLRVLFGSRWLLLIPFGLYLFSTAGVAATTWWAVAINQLPHQIAVAGLVTAHVLYLRSRHRRWVVVGCLFLLLGFGTYVKTVLAPVVLLFLTLAYFCTGSVGRRLLLTIRRDYVAWLPYGALTLGYTVAYLLTGDEEPPLKLGPETVELVVDHLVLTMPSAITGGPWDWTEWTAPLAIATPPIAVIVLGWLLIAAVVAVTGLRRRHALIGLALPLGYLLLSLVFIIQSRSLLTAFRGPAIVSQQMQYLADFVLVAALGLALMLLPLRGSLESSGPRGPAVLRLPWTPTTRRLGVGFVIVAMLVVAVTSNLRYASYWRGDWDQRRFFTTAMAEVREQEPLLADTAVPDEALSGLYVKYKPIRRIMSPLQDHFTIADSGTDLRMFTATGELATATVEAENRMIESVDTCQRVTHDSRWIDIVPTVDFGLWTAIDLRASRTTEVELVLGPQHVVATVPGGRSTLLVSTSRAFESVYVRPEIGKSVCIQEIRVGELVAEDER